MFTLPHFLATTGGAYKLAIATADQTPAFTDVLGAPIKEARFSEAKVQYGDSGKAELIIPVTGSKQKGDLHALAVMQGGRWKLRQLTLELTPSGERIDLLANR
jgi:hypothetical protein